MRIFLCILTVLTCVFLVAHSAQAQQDQTLIKNAEAYLEDFTTARARFVQTTHDGTQLVGTFYLDRPGKLRFEYDDPIKDFVVADGYFIYFYDAENEEQTNAPIGQTLADFILRDNILLSEDVTVVSTRTIGDLELIEMAQSADPEAGRIILGFEKQPFQLKKWRVIDAQGMITEVELFYLKTGVVHDNGIFIYKDPLKGKRPAYND